MAVSRKRLLITAIKCAVSGALIYWILRGTNLPEIAAALRSVNLPLLGVAFSLHFIGYYVSALRWRLLLKAQGVQASLPFLTQSYLISTFFNNLLPSTIGGDSYRIYDSWRAGSSKSEAVAVVFVDRFLGLVALMLFAVVALLGPQRLSDQIPLLNLWVGLGTATMGLVLWLIFRPSSELLKQVENSSLPLAGFVRRLLSKMIGAFLAFQGRRDTLAQALGLSVLLQVNVVVHYYLVSAALGLPVPLLSFFLIVPLATFVMMIPISINAIGIRESIFAFFFLPFGVANADAVAFSWLVYGIGILQGLIGGIVYALRK